MKKLFSLQLLLAFLLSGPAHSQYTIALDYDTLAVTIVNGYAHFNSPSVGTSPCEPAVPFYSYRFLLPPDADLATVSFSLFDTVTDVLDSEYLVKPTSPPVTGNGDTVWPTGITIVDGKDVATYSTNAYFPASHLWRQSVGMGRQYKLADVFVCPYLYNPVSRKLKVVISGKLQANFGVIPGFVVTIPRALWYEAMLKNNIDNDTNVFLLYELPSAVKSFAVSAGRKTLESSIMLVCGNTFRIPAGYTGRESRVSIYDFQGKRLCAVTTKGPVVSLNEGIGLSARKYVAEIVPLK